MKILDLMAEALKPRGNFSEEQRKLIIHKNGIVLGINTLYLLWMLTRWLILRISSTNDFLCMFIPLFVEWVVTLLYCRSRPTTYHYVYWLRVIVYGPLSRFLMRASFLTNFTATLILPLQALYIGENVYNFLAICGWNILGSLFLYGENLEVMALTLSPREFTKAFMIIFLIVQVVSMILLYGIHSSFQVYKEKILKEESNGILADKQRNFLLSFSHELRNLMNSIIGNIQICLLEDFPPQLREYLTDAKLSSEVLLNLINNILDSGKAEIGELEIDSREFNIHQKLKELWRPNLVLIERKGLKGRFTISKNLPKNIECDYYRVAQIINNLISNAIKFTDKGTIELIAFWYPGRQGVTSASFDPQPFDDEGQYTKVKNLSYISREYYNVGSQELNNYGYNPVTSEIGVLRIDVVDTGCGIDAANLDKIFLRYMQDPNGTSRERISTGLGLYVTREICRKMRGEIKAFSKKGFGSAFVICLPAKVVKPKETIKKPRCLVYIDRPAEIAIVKENIEKAGIEVIGVSSTDDEILLCLKNLNQVGKIPDGLMIKTLVDSRAKSIIKKIMDLENETGHLYKKVVLVNDCEIPEIDWRMQRLKRISTVSNLDELKKIFY